MISSLVGGISTFIWTDTYQSHNPLIDEYGDFYKTVKVHIPLPKCLDASAFENLVSYKSEQLPYSYIHTPLRIHALVNSSKQMEESFMIYLVQELLNHISTLQNVLIFTLLLVMSPDMKSRPRPIQLVRTVLGMDWSLTNHQASLKRPSPPS